MIMTKPRTVHNKTVILSAIAFFAATHATAQAQVRIDETGLVLPSPVRFESGSDVLAPGSDKGLEDVMQFLAEKTYITLLRVETNAAILADREDNAQLGVRRAKRLAQWFNDHGMDCKRLIFVTFGQEKPVAAGKDERNERIEFRPATLRNIKIGGTPVDGFGFVVVPPCKQD
jgi:outer membrane protein OmpA-like peptidoglycan-associated protein